MGWRTLALRGYLLGIQFGLIHGMNQEAMALRIPSKCSPEFSKHGSYALDKCMAFCMMNLDEPACHGIDIDFGQQTCQHLTFNFTTISCLGSLLLTRNQTSSNEIYLKTEHLGSIHSIDRALYFANLEDGKLVSVSGANESLVDLSFPQILGLNRIDMSIEYQNGIVACQTTTLQCVHWNFDADEYTPFPPLKRVHNQFEELAAFGSKLIVVGNTRTYDALESVHIYEPKTRDWVFGPDLLHARIMVAIVTLNSTSVMAVGGQIHGHGSLLFLDLICWPFITVRHSEIERGKPKLSPFF
ncbi:uncharacterized protein LOC131882023 [Tigriopus californicus]|uniref:uncharacterized protein LOC131882023 n=1 Tax=Tigriopus californicus TaxID=6832 RepID=UPI0027D9F5FF|nr:uncharacterized protein LOC131882023 [Tigriopus californicus]